MNRVRALIIASHPGPSLAITAMATLLAAEAAPHGIGPVLTAPAMLAGPAVGRLVQRRLRRAPRRRGGPDGQADRRRRDQRAGGVDRGLRLAAGRARDGAGHQRAYRCSSWSWSSAPRGRTTSASSRRPGPGSCTWLGFGPIPAYAASTLPGHPAPRWSVTAAAALVGLGAHFANVLPDLAGDQATGVKGLPQQVAARWGPARCGPPRWCCCWRRPCCWCWRPATPGGGSPWPGSSPRPCSA